MLEEGKIKQVIKRDDLALFLKHYELLPLNGNLVYYNESLEKAFNNGYLPAIVFQNYN
jgi:hypothetical protein